MENKLRQNLPIAKITDRIAKQITNVACCDLAPMLPNQYVTVFAESVVKYGENILKDPVQANRYYDRFTKALHDLAVIGDEGLSALAGLLDDERVAVRVTAASYLVHCKTEKALKVLSAARKEDRAIAMLAIVTLKRWETGSYLDPVSGREVKIKPKEQ